MSNAEGRSTVIIEDVLGDFGFRVRWTAQLHWVNVEAYEIVSYQADGLKLPFFLKDGYRDSGDQTPDINDADRYLHGYVKWDGCAELTQGTPHFCGEVDFEKHVSLLRYIWTRSQELLKSVADVH